MREECAQNPYVTPPAPLLLSARDAARALSISERTLFTLTKSGGLPSVKLGGRRLYRPEALRVWLAEREQAEPEEGGGQ